MSLKQIDLPDSFMHRQDMAAVVHRFCECGYADDVVSSGRNLEFHKGTGRHWPTVLKKQSLNLLHRQMLADGKASLTSHLRDDNHATLCLRNTKLTYIIRWGIKPSIDSSKRVHDLSSPVYPTHMMNVYKHVLSTKLTRTALGRAHNLRQTEQFTFRILPADKI